MPTTVNGPPPTQAMSDVPPPTLAFGAPPAPPGAPSGPGFGPPPGPPGPSGPSGPGFGPPPAPPGSKTNTTFIVVAVIAVLALAGIAFAVSQDGDDEDGGGVAAGDGPGVTAPDVTTLDPDDLPSDGGDLPSDGGDLPSDEPGGLEPPEDFEPPEDTAPILEPAEAEVDDCIAVDSGGYFTGTGSCADGGTPYVVTEVVEGTQTCSNPEASYTPSGDYLLCLEYNLVETYCYVFPEGASGGVDGWITVASACEAPGTVHVIDIVPGADNGDQCTSDYEWNYWYGFTAPHMVACVMKY